MKSQRLMNWAKVGELTQRQQYRLLLQLTQNLPIRKMDELVRGQKLLSIDSAMWTEALRFRMLAGEVTV